MQSFQSFDLVYKDTQTECCAMGGGAIWGSYTHEDNAYVYTLWRVSEERNKKYILEGSMQLIAELRRVKDVQGFKRKDEKHCGNHCMHVMNGEMGEWDSTEFTKGRRVLKSEIAR